MHRGRDPAQGKARLALNTQAVGWRAPLPRRFTQVQPSGDSSNSPGISNTMTGASLGYLAGGNQVLFGWNGAAFTLLSGPNPGNAHFLGLVAFGKNDALVCDNTQKIHRYLGSLKADGGTTTDFWVDLTAAGSGPFRALQGTGPDDVWVAGDNNLILHFGD